jgi:hypothetical protein
MMVVQALIPSVATASRSPQLVELRSRQPPQLQMRLSLDAWYMRPVPLHDTLHPQSLRKCKGRQRVDQRSSIGHLGRQVVVIGQ